jgi:hypothetical protein
MDEKKLNELLGNVRSGTITVEQAMIRLKHLPFEKLGFAKVDHHRNLRTGMPEVVYGENKSAEQIAAILKKIIEQFSFPMATRVSKEKSEYILKEVPGLIYNDLAMMITGQEKDIPAVDGRGIVLVICAGTSDIPVCEEAVVTCRCLGNKVETLYDVGVAGIHRLLEHKELMDSASVLIVVAGMEGALPSVVGGLVDKPVIAVPTSVGYGTGFGGIAALLGMLNSCAPGVAVVNIDNGFGAGCFAAAINRQ